MLQQFLDFIAKEKLGDKSRKYLLAVSGGVDSAVMSELFFRAGFTFSLAHCNFRLRGNDSDQDDQFVKTLAARYCVPFYKKKFDTKAFAEKKKISVQMAARELRYEWLNRLAKEKNYDFIATAHHLDDSIETFFINLLRGTGIVGLQGIPVKQGIIIRPMLFATKSLILSFARENGLGWREDASNLTDKYLRNAIRHHLIPSLKKLNEGFEKTIVKELSYFKEAADVFKKFIDEKKKEVVETSGKNVLLNIRKLKESGHAETLLHEILRAYDFTPETTELVAKQLFTAAGKKFLSPTYRLIKDRDFLILTPKKKKEADVPLYIEEGLEKVKSGELELSLEIIKGGKEKITGKNPSVAWLDYDKLEFPLMLRKWKYGDVFQPLGMKGRKKLSDFFTDIKLSLPEKEAAFVLFSGENIVWVIPYRTDDRYKITLSTKKTLKISAIHR